MTILIPSRGQPAEPLKVELFQSSGSLWDTFHVEISQDHEGKPRFFSGMVHVQAHAQQTLQILDADSGIKLRGILESLLYAIPHAISLLFPVETEMASLEDMSNFQAFRQGNGSTHWMAYLTRHFLDAWRIYRTMCKYLGISAKDTMGFKQLPLDTCGMLLPSPLLSFRVRTAV